MSFNVYYECKIPCENEEIVVRAGTPAAGNDGRKWPAHETRPRPLHDTPTRCRLHPLLHITLDIHYHCSLRATSKIVLLHTGYES